MTGSGIEDRAASSPRSSSSIAETHDAPSAKAQSAEGTDFTNLTSADRSPSSLIEPHIAFEQKADMKRKATVTPDVASFSSAGLPDLTSGEGHIPTEMDPDYFFAATATDDLRPTAVEEGSPLKENRTMWRPERRAMKRARVKAEDIPDFDYANEPNLLDHPSRFSLAREGRSKEKTKGKPGDFIRGYQYGSEEAVLMQVEQVYLTLSLGGPRWIRVVPRKEIGRVRLHEVTRSLKMYPRSMHACPGTA